MELSIRMIRRAAVIGSKVAFAVGVETVKVGTPAVVETAKVAWKGAKETAEAAYKAGSQAYADATEQLDMQEALEENERKAEAPAQEAPATA
jgi:hypothetical protein